MRSIPMNGGVKTTVNCISDVEDRFIGVVDYKEFLHNPQDVYLHPAGSLTEARYRKTLETQMGLGGSHLMLFQGSGRANHSFWRDADGGACSTWPDTLIQEGDNCEAGEQQRSLFMDPATIMQGMCEECYTPPSSPNHPRFRFSLMNATAKHGGTSAVSSPKAAPAACPDSHNDCHTPLPHSRLKLNTADNTRSPGAVCETIGVPCSHSQRVDTYWATPILTSTTPGLRTPVHGSRCGDAAGAYPVSPHPGCTAPLHLATPPQLRTPVMHENDLLSTPVRGCRTNSIVVSQNGSPVPRRSALYSHHMTPRRQTDVCDRVLNAEGLSLCDTQDRPNFNPLCWGYLGAVIALQRIVYLWQGPGKVYTLFESVLSGNLVSSVASSRRTTDAGDVYMAFGMSDGLTVVMKYHVGNDILTGNGGQPMSTDTVFERALRSLFRDHVSHVSTVQVVGHYLYTGCMDGILTARDLRDGSVIWQDAQCHQNTASFCHLSQPTIFRVNVGAPIYKLEVTPDGEHIAVGTDDSLFVYQANRMGPDNRTKRRVVLANASRPVRAFCWWGPPLNSLSVPAADTHYSSSSNNGIYGFLHRVLLYGGGADGCVLSVYPLGSRGDKARCRLPTPILGIVSSETSNEIVVSIDAPKTSRDNNASVAARNTNDPEAEGSGVGDNEWISYDPSSDEDGLPQVLYVSQHNPISRSSSSSGVGGISRPMTRHFTHRSNGARMRPPLPRIGQPRNNSAQGVELLQLFHMKDGGETLEQVNGFLGIQNTSLYMALSPDNSFLSTAGDEMKIRIWRTFTAKTSESAHPCELR